MSAPIPEPRYFYVTTRADLSRLFDVRWELPLVWGRHTLVVAERYRNILRDAAVETDDEGVFTEYGSRLSVPVNAEPIGSFSGSAWEFRLLVKSEEALVQLNARVEIPTQLVRPPRHAIFQPWLSLTHDERMP